VNEDDDPPLTSDSTCLTDMAVQCRGVFCT